MAKITRSGSPIKVNVDKDSQVGIEKIENGFIVSESGYTGKGRNQKWYNKKYFSPTNPLALLTKGGSAPMKFSGKKK